MTEQQWLTSADPQAMLRFFNDEPEQRLKNVSVRPTDRKLRLYAAGCCRLAWSSLVDDAPCDFCHGGRVHRIEFGANCPRCGGTGRTNRSRAAVVTAERYADGEATAVELRAAHADAHLGMSSEDRAERHPHEGIARLCSWTTDLAVAVETIQLAVTEAGLIPPAAQAGLLRCVFGNPWRPVTPQTVGKKVCKPFPEHGCLMVYAVSEGAGPVGPRLGNRFVGWRVAQNGKDLSPVFKRRKDAERWAEENFYVSGWQSSNGAHHQRYVVPGPGKARIVSPPWLTPTVLALAGAAYHERLPDGLLDPAALAVLADALEEAGCAGETVALCCCGKPLNGSHDHNSCGPPIEEYVPHPLLAHLRGPGPHARGCWAVDLVLGKADAPAPRRPPGRQTGPDACPHCDGHGTTLGAGPDRGNPTCDRCGGTGRRPAEDTVEEGLVVGDFVRRTRAGVWVGCDRPEAGGIFVTYQQYGGHFCGRVRRYDDVDVLVPVRATARPRSDMVRGETR